MSKDELDKLIDEYIMTQVATMRRTELWNEIQKATDGNASAAITGRRSELSADKRAKMH